MRHAGFVVDARDTQKEASNPDAVCALAKRGALLVPGRTRFGPNSTDDRAALTATSAFA
jgi:hypothetical protein